MTQDRQSLTIKDLSELATTTVPQAGRFFGLGRDASYGAAKRGELPTLRFGRRLVVPVPRLLDLLGVPNTESDAGSSQEPATATTTSTLMEFRHDDSAPPAA